MKVGIQPADDYTFFYGNGNAIYHLRTGFFIHKAVITAVMRVEFISDRMPYKTLRDFWCDIIVPNVHAPTDDRKDSFYEGLESVFNHFPKKDMNIL